jgi:hypothetical protein
MMEQEDRALLPSSSLNEADYNNDNSNHQRDVNEPSHRVTGDQPQQPQNYQYYSNRPQHVILLLSNEFYRNRLRSFSNESSLREISPLSLGVEYLPPSVIRK